MSTGIAAGTNMSMTTAMKTEGWAAAAATLTERAAALRGR